MGVQRPLRERLNNWSPSLGFAWDPQGDGKTSVRANFRVAYDRINTQVISSQIYNTIPGVSLGAVNQAFGLSGGAGGTGGRIRDGSVGDSARGHEAGRADAAGGIRGRRNHHHRPGLRVPDDQHVAVRHPARDRPEHRRRRGLHRARASHLFGAYNINQVDIFRNGFLDAYRVVAAGGDSALMNQLFGPDSRRQANETGSQFVRRQFAAQIALNSVAAIAADAASRVESGTPLLQRAGLARPSSAPSRSSRRST